MQLKTDGFINTTADTVAADGGFIDFFRNDNGEALAVTLVTMENEAEMRAADGPSLFIGVFNTTARVKTILF